MAWRSGGTHTAWVDELLYNQSKNTQITPIIYCTLVKVEAQFGGMERKGKKMEVGRVNQKTVPAR
jgi:hypothetical protein